MPFGKPTPCNFIVSKISITVIYDVCPISKESPGASCAGRFPTIDVPGEVNISVLFYSMGDSPITPHSRQQITGITTEVSTTVR